MCCVIYYCWSDTFAWEHRNSFMLSRWFSKSNVPSTLWKNVILYVSPRIHRTMITLVWRPWPALVFRLKQTWGMLPCVVQDVLTSNFNCCSTNKNALSKQYLLTCHFDYRDIFSCVAFFDHTSVGIRSELSPILKRNAIPLVIPMTICFVKSLDQFKLLLLCDQWQKWWSGGLLKVLFNRGTTVHKV